VELEKSSKLQNNLEMSRRHSVIFISVAAAVTALSPAFAEDQAPGGTYAPLPPVPQQRAPGDVPPPPPPDANVPIEQRYADAIKNGTVTIVKTDSVDAVVATERTLADSIANGTIEVKKSGIDRSTTGITKLFDAAIKAGAFEIVKAKSGYSLPIGITDTKDVKGVVITASKKGAKTLTLKINLDGVGNLILPTKTDLKDYNLNIKQDGKIVKSIPIKK
jgi:hypothetical protein